MSKNRIAYPLCALIALFTLFQPVKLEASITATTIQIGDVSMGDVYPNGTPPYIYAKFDAAGYSDIGIFYGRSPIHPHPYHELLSGEWAAAIYYNGISTNDKAMWLTDKFLYPDWTTNSDFQVTGTPSAWSDTNNITPLIDTGKSNISNNDLEVQVDYEIVDLSVCADNGWIGSPMSYFEENGNGSLCMPSDRYVILQTYTLKNITTSTITGLEFYQFLHSHGANQYSAVVNSTYCGAKYPDPLENYVPVNSVHNIGNFRYDITQWNSNTTHRDWVSFSSVLEPDWIDTDVYDGHSGKPLIGTHINIENRQLNGLDAIYNSEVGGAMGWNLDSLDPNETTSITVVFMCGAETTATPCTLGFTKTSSIVSGATSVNPISSEPNDYTLTYIINYGNPTTDTADPNYLGVVENVTITDYLPKEINPVSVSVSNNGNYDMIEGKATWTIGTLNPGDSGSVSITVEISDSAEPGGKIINSAILDSSAGWMKAVCETPVSCYDNDIIYVKSDASALGDNNGRSWGDAYKTLTKALNRASVCGANEIWVAKGIYYTGTETTDSFIIPDGIKIYGGFCGNESSKDQRNFINNKTILSGDFDKDNAAETTNLITVGENVGVVNETVLDGFIITKSTSKAVYCDKGNLKLRNCIITENNGDAVYLDDTDTEVKNCVISLNGSDGIYVTGSSSGGGTPIIIHNNIYGNEDNGIYLSSNYTRPEITNNFICDNGVDGSGMGIYISFAPTGLTIRNNTIAYNDDEGIYKSSTSGTVSVKNCIVWNNNLQENYEPFCNITATYSCYNDLSDPNRVGPDANGNLTVDPQFVPYDGDYHLLSLSDCINSGNSTGIVTTGDGAEVDIDGNPRVDGTNVDMGADEVVCSDTANDADINIDAIVNLHDFCILASAWESIPTDDPNDPNTPNWNPVCDLNDDSVVNESDLLVIAGSWLWQPCYKTSGSVMAMDSGIAGRSVEEISMVAVSSIESSMMSDIKSQRDSDFMRQQPTTLQTFGTRSLAAPTVEDEIAEMEVTLKWLYEIYETQELKDQIDEATWLNFIAGFEDSLDDLKAKQSDEIMTK